MFLLENFCECVGTRPEVLPWSEQDFLGGLEENLRIVQECEAKFARMMASHPEVWVEKSGTGG